MRLRSIISLVPTVLLCLPSLMGAVAWLENAIFQRRIGEWGPASSASVAAAILFGGPLVVLAAIFSTLVGLNRKVSAGVKFANYGIVAFSGLAILSLGTFLRW